MAKFKGVHSGLLSTKYILYRSNSQLKDKPEILRKQESYCYAQDDKDLIHNSQFTIKI